MDRLYQLTKKGMLPTNIDDFDSRLLLPALTAVSYKVTINTVLLNKQSFKKDYIIFLERPYDAFEHLRSLQSQQFALGMEIENMGSYMFKSVSDKGYSLFSIEPVQSQSNLLQNTN